MVRNGAEFRGNVTLEIEFHFPRCFSFRQSKSVRYTEDVSIDSYYGLVVND